MSNWITERNQRTRQLEDYVKDLEEKYRFGVGELSQISAGITYSDQPSNWSLSGRMQDRAARTLSKLAQMRQRDKPLIYW